MISLAAWLAYRWSEFHDLAELQSRASHRLELYANGLKSELDRFLYIPGIVELERDILAILETPSDPTRRQNANVYLERLNERTRAGVIYLLDHSGRVLASSNWHQPDSFVGMDFSYRPYFQTALRGEHGHFFGVGTTSGLPGYYASHPVRREGQIVGVAVVKFSLDALERSWSGDEGRVLLVDGNGVVIQSSDQAWKFTTLRPLHPSVQDELARTRQYDKKVLRPLDMVVIDDLGNRLQIVSFQTEHLEAGLFNDVGREFFAQSWRVADSDWELMVLSEFDTVRATAINHGALATTTAAFGWMLLLFLNERHRNVKISLAAKAALERAYGELEQRVQERTADLTTANARLQAEIEERERTERDLRTTENELVQAGKLAVLGQLATGITHELNQPLAALRTLADNTIKFLQRGDLETARSNLATIGQLVERMGHITGQLKVFARKSPPRPQPVEVHTSVRNALLLLDSRVRKEGVRVEVAEPEQSLVARCDPIRLEQVLINLIGNALDAMKGAAVKHLWIRCAAEHDHIVIHIRDSGSGLDEEIQQHLFEPFFTTKEPGVGLGLGLAISAGITREFGGVLHGSNHPEGGAVFTIELPTAQEVASA